MTGSRNIKSVADLVSHFREVKLRRGSRRRPCRFELKGELEAIATDGRIITGHYPFQSVVIVRRICTLAAQAHGVTVRDILSERRDGPAVRARQQAMYQIRHLTSWSTPRIGRFLGGRDHTTVIHGVRAHERRLSNRGERSAPGAGRRYV